MAAVIYTPAYGRYDFGPSHPFSPVRLEMTLDLLRELGHPPATVTPPAAWREDVLTVHDEDYVMAVEALSAGERVEDALRWGLGTADTPVFPGMEEAARLLVGGTLEAARLVADGTESRVVQLGGGLHHAHPARASGFCIYNDLAVAIRHLAARDRWVAYLDLDVHHGDGVQAAFYGDDRVMTISLHESGQYLFPGSGAVHELGHGVGRGLKMNIPLEPFTEGASYLEVFDMLVPRALEWFGPHVLVVQAGADAHYQDPLADLALTTRDYEALFRRVIELADRLTDGRVIFTLGGGYSMTVAPRVWAILDLVVHDLQVPTGLPRPWVERWREQLGDRPPAGLHDPDPAFAPVPRRDEIAGHNRQVAERVLEAFSPFWF